MSYHPDMEKLVSVLCTRTQTTEQHFFRIQVAYFLGVVASQMRVEITGWANTKIPANIYAVNLAPSGIGKGYSTSILEGEVLKKFKRVFLEETFPVRAKQNLQQIASDRSVRNGTDEDQEYSKVVKEFNTIGSLLFSFDSATSPAIKQMRHKLLLGHSGSMNIQIDEIGANLVSQIEPLNTFLELYDKGAVKEKLIKSSAENLRTERIDGFTPANMLLFGTPSKLLDGAETEKKFYEMMEMGYARRCLFGYTEKVAKDSSKSSKELLEDMQNTGNLEYLEQLTDRFADLADISKLQTKVFIGQEQCLELLEYKLACEGLSRTIPEHETSRKAEMDHRYFKVLKLAGAYAFYDGSATITSNHLAYAIQLAEDSGNEFSKLIKPERPYVKLAKYLAALGTEVTLADLDSDLAYMRGGKNQKDELITMATSWGVKNNHIVKKAYRDGIMFLSGTTIEKTDLAKCVLTYSTDMTKGYNNSYAPWVSLPKLFKHAETLHWVNHHLMDEFHKPTLNQGYRNDRNIVEGFNLLVLDVDNTTTLQTAQVLLKNFQYHMYTTKSHGINNEHRFRIILPINYCLHLDVDDYKTMMGNIFKSLPFSVDESGNHRCKKWETHPNTTVYSNEGDLFDVIPFIPKTTKNEEREQRFLDQSALDGLERWVINNTGDGNRNVQLYKYAMVLVDTGKSFENIRQAVIQLNDKLPDKLEEAELYSTIMASVSKRLNV